MRTLVADIGGTNSRFAMVGQAPSDLVDVRTYLNDDFSSFDEVFRHVLNDVQGSIDQATIAIAGPVHPAGGRLTNRGWKIESLRLSIAAGGVPVQIVNDFEALAQSLPYLTDDGLTTIYGRKGQASGHKLAIGPGTGLGVGSLASSEHGWIALPGEGGHMSLPIKTRREFELMDQIRSGSSRVIAEDVLSGPGLVKLYCAVAKLAGSTKIAETPASVLAAFSAGDHIARESVLVFVRFLGRLVGDVALALLPKGGVFLGGGVTNRVFDLVGTEAFLEEMHDKGSVSRVLTDISVHIIKEPNPGLIGSGVIAKLSAERSC